MGRTRTGAQLIDDAYERADLVGVTDRHPRTTVLRHVNQGGAELYDLLVLARGPAFYAVKPAYAITTAANTSRYALPAAFYRLSAVRVAGVGGYTLDPYGPQDEPFLREPGVTACKPTHYELQPGFIELLPLHAASLTIALDYVPVFPDLADDTTTFDGINGWEEYIVDYAAREMLIHDGELEDAASRDRAMQAMAVRISKLAPKRDAFRARRVQNVRSGGGPGPWGRW